MSIYIVYLLYVYNIVHVIYKYLFKTSKKKSRKERHFFTHVYIYIYNVHIKCMPLYMLYINTFLKPFLKKKEKKIYQEEKKIELC